MSGRSEVESVTSTSECCGVEVSVRVLRLQVYGFVGTGDSA